MNFKKNFVAITIFFFLLVEGCARHTYESQRQFDLNGTPNAQPRAEPRSKYGNPDCYSVDGRTYQVMKTSKGYCKTGLASWYGLKFHGRKTSSREPYDMFAMTAASPYLPIPTYVEVTNLENGKKIVVKVNDRGPFKSDRLIDLSYAAASKLGFANKGTASVEVRAIDTVEFSRSNIPQEMVFANKPLELPEIQINIDALEKSHKPKQAIVLEKFLQIGAFAQRDNAKRLQREIALITDAPVLIKEGLSKNRPIYRVQVGPFKDQDEANSMKEKLKAKGLSVITVFS